MAKADSDLDRLLRAAAQDSEPELEMPFGFDTRVVALAKARGAARGAEGWELMRLYTYFITWNNGCSDKYCIF